MRVFMFCPEPLGGIFHYSVQLCRGLHEVGAQATLATSPEHDLKSQTLPFEIVEPFRYRRGTFFDKTWVRRSGLRKLANALIYLTSLTRTAFLIRRGKPDLVHVQGFFGSVLGLVTLRLLAHLGRTPIVVTLHNLASRRRYIGEGIVVRLTLPVVQGLVVHSKYGQEQLLKSYPGIKRRLFAIPLGNFMLFEGDSKAAPAECRRRLGLPADSAVILFFGFIKPYKGLDCLLGAFALIQRNISNARLLIAGQPKESFAKYEEMIRDHGIEGRTITDLDYIPMERARDYFAAADVVVLPYKHERSDTVVVDQSGVAQIAYAFAKPVVASNIGGLAEVVVDGESGYTVRPDSPEALAEALVRILNRPDRGRGMGRRGYELATTKFSWATIAAQHLAAYRSVLGRSSDRTEDESDGE